jgi:protein-disulfide isomerase
MRGLAALVLVMAAAAPVAHAADGTLATGGAHEVVWTPATTLPVRGPRFAPVTVDVYVALGHLPSYSSAELARRAVARAGDVREVVHPFGFGTAAELAVEALLEAAEQGRFWELFDRLAQTRLATFTAAELGRLGREAGLDGARLDAALAVPRHQAGAERVRRDARQSGHHPPELLVNGRRLSPWSGEDALTRAINEARTRARELLAEGVPLSQLYERLIERDEEVPFVIDPLSRSSRRRVGVDLTGAPVRGPATAPVTIVIFGNLACMPCAELAASLKRLGTAYPGLVRVAWKNFPSPYRASIGEVAAEYAAAAAAQGRFWDVYDAAMATRLQPLKTTPAELERMGTSAGVDGARVHAEVASGRAKAAVERDAEEARRLGVPTAGSVVVNGIPVAGAPSYELLDRLVAAELDVGVLERLRRR